MPETSIIFLNGPSSSGKSTLARALKRALESPYFHFSADQLIKAKVLPRKDRCAEDSKSPWRIMRPHFFNGVPHCIAALAAAGNPLIVEHPLEYQFWLDDCVELLAPFDVFFVGVHCPLEEMERRERKRGDRKIGASRLHLENGIHRRGPYDFEVNTHTHRPCENAQLIRAALINKPSPSAFRRMYSQRS
jgi:chloramphenicol 3-O phosphotransferase